MAKKMYLVALTSTTKNKPTESVYQLCTSKWDAMCTLEDLWAMTDECFFGANIHKWGSVRQRVCDGNSIKAGKDWFSFEGGDDYVYCRVTAITPDKDPIHVNKDCFVFSYEKNNE